jgi:hypothetical protein
MADLAAARAALKNVEGILRRRYHYPHPIFEHLASAQGHIAEGAPKVQAKVPPEPEKAAAKPKEVTSR